jgi:hypothetical protein
MVRHAKPPQNAANVEKTRPFTLPGAVRFDKPLGSGDGR